MEQKRVGRGGYLDEITISFSKILLVIPMNICFTSIKSTLSYNFVSLFKPTTYFIKSILILFTNSTLNLNTPIYSLIAENYKQIHDDQYLNVSIFFSFTFSIAMIYILFIIGYIENYLYESNPLVLFPIGIKKDREIVMKWKIDYCCCCRCRMIVWNSQID